MTSRHDSYNKLITMHLRPLERFVEDNDVTEIMVNSGGHVFVEAKGVITHYPDSRMHDNDIQQILNAVATSSNIDLHTDTASGIINASLHDFRIAGAVSGISPDGAFFTIRKHQNKEKRPTLDQLIEWGAISREHADMLVKLIVTDHKNCLFAGGTGSGKTTITNAVLSGLPNSERVVVIEDVSELQIKVPNTVRMLTNPDPARNRTARDLVKLAMRLRPDRLILGETRGDDTFDLIRAFNSGHPGSISTVHANSDEETLDAIEMLFQQSIPKGATISTDSIRKSIARAINCVVFCGRRNIERNGVVYVVRKIENILIVKGVSNGKYEYERI